LLIGLIVCVLAGCNADIPISGLSPRPPVHRNGLALWLLVNNLCIPGQRHRGTPSPCAIVSMGKGREEGFALFKDRSGAAHYLLIPAVRITGIEDPKLLEMGAPNYFRLAWDERRMVPKSLGRPMAADRLSVAVNSIYGRSQDQLHLHIDCISAAVQGELSAQSPRIGRSWSQLKEPLAGRRYWARRLDGPDLADDPFLLLADGLPGARQEMGAWTLVLIGAAGDDGRQGFYLLADRAEPETGAAASGEVLQDHSCSAGKG
jgi:CDP-diacylglycerol pyrophosphatase